MGIIELLVIAVGVSMDAFAVSVCKGLSVSRVRPAHALKTGLWFGGFQAMMPLIGFFLGMSFADLVSAVDHWIAFVLLALIGADMIKESFDRKDSTSAKDADFSSGTMLAMAVATSIDALAIGVSFAFLNVNIWAAVLCIGLVTGIFSAAGVYVGNVFGRRYKSMAELAGGVILVVMGLKILIEHTML